MTVDFRQVVVSTTYRAASRELQGRRREAMAGGGGREAMDGGREAMARFVKFVKQYPGPEQVDLCVEFEVPGSWFGGTERSLKYKAQAVEYADVREFPGPSSKSRKTKEKALCV